jgi:hypothetical protein
MTASSLPPAEEYRLRVFLDGITFICRQWNIGITGASLCVRSGPAPAERYVCDGTLALIAVPEAKVAKASPAPTRVVRQASVSNAPRTSPEPHRPAKSAPMTGAMLRDAIAAESARFMDRKLSSGVMVGDADQSMLIAEANRHKKKSRWFMAIADQLKRNGFSHSRVRDCLSERTLAQLWVESDV